ncbi:MAG: carboxypeptidase M32 [Candidatus Uhrbacteria bacterium]|nr:carboxypeptidase M32 [Candidatus Uhrbacteria bacterium]
MKNADYGKLVDRLIELSYIGSAMAVLHWDQEVHMPEKGSAMRAKTLGYMSGLLHDQFLALNDKRMLDRLRKTVGTSKTPEGAVVRDILRAYDREKKLPKAFVEEMSVVCSEAQTVWAKAREASDFAMFAPHLKKIVALKRKEAKLVGFTESPYDALLDVYEPDMTSKRITKLFDELKARLLPLIPKSGKPPTLPKGPYPIAAQRTFNELVAKTMGFDFDKGRLDISSHPFTIHFHPEDVRMTTRYREEDPMYSIGSTIHETGHALYEQGLPIAHFGTALGESISLGIHESQSRVWENIIGKSKGFWTYFYPHLQAAFPKQLKKYSLDQFLAYVNHVVPSFIRTEADEVTYNLHVILRFEIEKDLIEGKIEVDELPAIWNAKMKDYLGVDVPNDRLGVLQDVHWSGGMIGYFPTYVLGNMYAAQFYDQAKKDIRGLEGLYAKGKLAPIREWLRQNVHIHGKRYSAEELVKKVTGKKLSAEPFASYLVKKYGSGKAAV